MFGDSYQAQSGHVLLVPCSPEKMEEVTVQWQQDNEQRSARYHKKYVRVGQPAPTNGKSNQHVLFFIASEWYTGDSSSDSYISKIANRAGDFYEFTIDGRAQYGTENCSGEPRFVVYHDTSRKMSQYRLVGSGLTAIESVARGAFSWVPGFQTVSGLADKVLDPTKAIVGVPLHTF